MLLNEYEIEFMLKKIETFEIWAMFTLEVLTLLWAEPMRRTDLTSTLIYSFGEYVTSG
jgi:hypothetical protein